MYKRWAANYIEFYNDLISLYIKGLQIDRIDNNKGYFPGNIRWVSSKVNMRNRRNTFLNEEKVKEIRNSGYPHEKLAKIYGVKKQTISMIRSKTCLS